MRIFLDVGAHDGQTLAEVLKPEYRFDRVYAFEPMPAQYENLVVRFTPRSEPPELVLCEYGLANSTGSLPIFGTNDEMEASLYAGKADVDRRVVTICAFVQASAWFRATLPPAEDGATVVVKLNCEGAECEILDDLIDSGEIWKITTAAVDFDVRKIPGMEYREGEIVDRLRAIGFDRYADAGFAYGTALGDEPPDATHQDRIRYWLTHDERIN